MNVTRGLYVHYKGGIYFVLGVAKNGDDHGDETRLVIYETTQGCGDVVDKNGEADDSDDLGPRFRTVEDFTCPVDWATGLTDDEAHEAGVKNNGQLIPRFQRVLGWKNGHPLVAGSERNTMTYAFVPQTNNKTGFYQGPKE